MNSDDAAVPAASLILRDPRPSRQNTADRIELDVYGDLASAAAGGSSPDVAAAASAGCVIIFLHGGGFAAGDKNQ
jgi:acetyl esterase/lipase